jgi:putative DNA primase/helicase
MAAPVSCSEQHRYTPTVDIDVHDARVAEELEIILRFVTGGGQNIVRVGQAPKRAILFRTDRPSAKISTPVFVSPDGCEHHVEVLCDGQQVVVYGVHPETGGDYSWSHGEPCNVKRQELRHLDAAMAREFLDHAEECMKADGWIEKRKPNGTASTSERVNDFDELYGNREQKYAVAALHGCAAELAGTAKGGRNDKLNALAFRLGTMTARGWIGRDNVTARLMDAAKACGLVAEDGESSALKTLSSGLDAGEKSPHPDLQSNAGTEAWRQPSSAGDPAELQTVRASAVQQQPVCWLWKNRLARGKITLLGGDPGLGKSQIVINIIARISTGTPWPDSGTAPRGHCIILSAEDAASDVICPRLELAGADLDHITIIQSIREKDGRERGFNLQRDLDALRDKAATIGDVVLIGIDPVTAYLGDKIDSHRTTDVRAIMERLDKFGEQTGISVWAITHPPKQVQAKAINSFTGSLAFAAASRLCFISVEETETDRLLMLAVKNNLGAKADGIGYRLKAGTTPQGIESCAIEWDLTPVTVSANEALADAASEPKRGTQRREAEEFLKAYLEVGPMPVEKVKQAAEANGISGITLRRAREHLKIIVEKPDFTGGWRWRLP